VIWDGATDACALTRKKGEALPPAAPPDRWQFWMQTGRLQAEDGQYGFNLEAAADRYCCQGTQSLYRLNPAAWSSCHTEAL